jgi:hypothetical protein
VYEGWLRNKQTRQSSYSIEITRAGKRMGVRMRRQKLDNCFLRNSDRSVYIGLINLFFLLKVMVLVGKSKGILRCCWSLCLCSLLLLLFFISMYETAAWKKEEDEGPSRCTIRSVGILIAFIGEEKWLFFYHQQNDICRRFAHIALAVLIIYSSVILIDIDQAFAPHRSDESIRDGHTDGDDPHLKDRRSERREKRTICTYS